jgi:hypothetical protein
MRVSTPRFWVFLCVLALFSLQAEDGNRPFMSTLPHVDTIASTVPANGDVNPYGVAVVPVTNGSLVANNILVSNFNNFRNLQGLGTTIVQVSPSGNVTLFATINAGSLPATCPGGVGLTTALVALKSGFVIVGSLPTSDGTSATAQAGCLIVLNSSGASVAVFSGNGINGPWDMTAVDNGTTATLFVSNVLNGTVAANGQVVSHGTILRIGVSNLVQGGIPSAGPFTAIATAFDERTDPNALVIGPTGLGLSADGNTLFVADTLRSRIAAIQLSMTGDAGSGTTVAQGPPLNQPLGLAVAPDGHIITVNAGNGLMVETTPDGKQAAARNVDISHSKNGAGTLFGLAIAFDASAIYFVDDGNNTLNALH